MLSDQDKIINIGDAKLYIEAVLLTLPVLGHTTPLGRSKVGKNHGSEKKTK
jgi:hypothetical protein